MKRLLARESTGEKEKHCEVPPGIGRLYDPPHPAYGIAFLYVVSEALLFGARAGAWAPARVSFSHLGLWLCLLGAVHFLERVDPRHVLAKLGGARPSVRWLGTAASAALPGFVFLGMRGFEASYWLAAGCTALWQESFFRGFVFRSLMRRHGFFFSALVSTGLGTAAVLLHEAGNPWETLLLLAVGEAVLGLALCQLFGSWRAGLWPCVLVRFSVPIAVLAHPAPPITTAFLLWILVLVVQRRTSPGPA